MSILSCFACKFAARESTFSFHGCTIRPYSLRLAEHSAIIMLFKPAMRSGITGHVAVAFLLQQPLRLPAETPELEPLHFLPPCSPFLPVLSLAPISFELADIPANIQYNAKRRHWRRTKLNL